MSVSAIHQVRTVLVVILMAALLASLACTARPAGDPDPSCPPGEPACAEPRDVAAFTMFRPQISGAMFEYETPTTAEVLKNGLFAAGASPTHIAVQGTPVANSLRCHWNDAVMTNHQRESALRYILNIPDDEDLPSTADLLTVVSSYVTGLQAQYRDAMQANLNHLASGGVLSGSRSLACYVDVTVAEYLLGTGPTTLTVVYDALAQSRSYDLYRRAHAAGRYGSTALMTESEFAAADAATLASVKTDVNDAVMGSQSVIFLAPMAAHRAIAVETWQVVAQWDVQTVDGVLTAVRFGTHEQDPEHSQSLADFKTLITSSAGGDGQAANRLTNANNLPAYYRDIGAYGNIAPADRTPIIFTPDQPPPADETPVAAPTEAPPIPSNVAASGVGNGVWITWDASTDPTVTGYQLLRRIRDVDATMQVLVDDTGSQTAAFLDTEGIRLGYNHIYRIAARNAQGLSTPSVRVNTTPPLPQVGSLTGAPTSTNVALRWSRSDWSDLELSAATDIRIMRHRQGDPAFIAVADVAANTNVYTDWDEDLSAGTYVYRIQTLAGTLVSPGSRVEVVVPAADPNNPGPVVSEAPLYLGMARASNNFLVDWVGQSTVDGQAVTGYSFEMSTSADGPFAAPPYYEPSGGIQCVAEMPVTTGVTGCALVFAGAGIPTDVASVRYFRLVAHGGDGVSETGPVREMQIAPF